jgi:phosphoenolpyruvate synthase/pyruvate phosphate dikinase
MPGHKTSLLIRVRPFGSHGTGVQAVWPQDKAQAAGFDVVPGFVVEVSLPQEASVSDISTAIEEATPYIADHWKRAIHSGIAQDERALVQVWTHPVMNSARDSFVLTNIENATNQRTTQKSKTVLETLRDLTTFCLCIQPAFEAKLTELQNRVLKYTHTMRFRHLTEEQVWGHVRDIGDAYHEFTGVHLPRTPVNQLTLALLQILQQPCHPNASAAGKGRSVSLSVRLRPMRLLTSASGSGVVLCGPGTEQLERRGSYAPSIGLDCIETGGFQVQPIEAILSDALLSQALDRINHVFVADLNDYYRVSFILVKQRFLIDTMARVTPTAEMLLAGAALRVQQGITPPPIEGITQKHIRSVLYSRLRLTENDRSVGQGIPAAPGACSGVLSTSIDSATRFHREGLPVIFCASSSMPEAMRALSFSEGAIFRTGGVTSHVAVIARGLGKPCILGIDSLSFIEERGREMKVAQTVISEGQWISMDGTGGRLYLGRIATVRTPLTSNSPLSRVLACCDATSRMSVYVNADSADEADEGFSYGAKAVGLCRIEHMLATPVALTKLGRALTLGLTSIDISADLLLAEMKSLIWSHSEAALKALQSCRQTALQGTSYQRFMEALTDLKGALKEKLCDLFAAAENRPVTIRFLDPPLSEFLSECLIDELTQDDLITAFEADTGKRILSTSGGMLGLRGIRLGLVLSELTEMQALAINDAAWEISTARKSPVAVNLMAPFISDPIELQLFRLIVTRCLTKGSNRFQPTFSFGGMIETPRAAMMAHELAQVSDFLSFGTNDLSQFVWASSRDSAETDFLGRLPYSAMDCAPFSQFDEKGVGAVIAYATKQAKRTKSLPVGICGEHARDEKAIRFFAALGIDYISCAPFAVPEARLAVAQAMSTKTASVSLTMKDHANEIPLSGSWKGED